MSDSLAITSGKGGVGKTTIAVNLSIALKKLASEIFLLDTDLGMANSHVLLGTNPGLSLSDVISGEKVLQRLLFLVKVEFNLFQVGQLQVIYLMLRIKKDIQF